MLVPDAVQVTAADPVTGTQEVQGINALQRVFAGIEVEVEDIIRQRLVQGDRHSADLLGQGDHRVEVHHRRVRHPHPGQPLHGGNRAAGASTAQSLVDLEKLLRLPRLPGLGVTAAGNLEHGVPGDRHHGGTTAVRRHVHQHDDVRQARTEGIAPGLRRLPLTGVGADDQDVLLTGGHRPHPVRRRRSGGGGGRDLSRGVRRRHRHRNFQGPRILGGQRSGHQVRRLQLRPPNTGRREDQEDDEHDCRTLAPPPHGRVTTQLPVGGGAEIGFVEVHAYPLRFLSS